MAIPTPILDPQNTTETKPSPLQLRIELFSSDNLLQQPFLPELKQVINTSYADHIGKEGLRLQSDTQIVDDVGESGFTAVATCTVSGEIVGTASVKPWGSTLTGITGMSWRPAGWYEGMRADEVVPGHLAPSPSSGEGVDSDGCCCEGDYEILLVAVKTGVQFRKKGIAEKLVRACEGGIKRRYRVSGSGSGTVSVSVSGEGNEEGEDTGEGKEKTKLRIMLKVVREINGEYCLKKGFTVVGECYCPPFTWDLKVAFVLWAMGRELVLDY